MATCARCGGFDGEHHQCPGQPLDVTGWMGDVFLGVVLGGAVGVLLFGMIGAALFGRALDVPGLVLGSIAGVTLVRRSRRLVLH
jgi:hypothetical protein